MVDLGAAKRRVGERARELALPSLAKILVAQAQFYWALDAIDPEIAEKAEASVGQVGGKPLVPAGFEWPQAQGKPMIGWLQIDLALLEHEIGLPRRGLLTVFLAHEDVPGPPTQTPQCDGGTVDVFDPDAGLEVASLPDGALVLAQRQLGATLRTSVPSSGSVHVYEQLRELAAAEEALWAREHELEDDELPPEDPADERYCALIDAVAPLGSRPLARLLGHPAPAQDDPLLEQAMRARTPPLRPPVDASELAGLREEAAGWRLLLQAGANRPLGYDILTGGELYLLMPAQDLEKARFDRVCAICQR